MKTTLGEVLNLLRERTTRAIHVATMGEISSFDPATQLAAVKVLLKETDTDETGAEVVKSLGVLSDVPVQFPSAGGFSLTFPVAAGDPCLLVFTDRSLDKWLDTGAEVDPVDLRRHDLTDAVAILGVRARPQAIPSVDLTAITLGKDGQPADFAALAAKVDARLAHLEAALNVHVHTSFGAPATPTPGVFPVEDITGSGIVGSVASATVKLKG